jgi:hypothetical protein
VIRKAGATALTARLMTRLTDSTRAASCPHRTRNPYNL